MPLDGHGNAIEEEEPFLESSHIRLEETQPLAVRMSMERGEDRVGDRFFITVRVLIHDLQDDASTITNTRTLFEVGEEEEDAEEFDK